MLCKSLLKSCAAQPCVSFYLWGLLVLGFRDSCLVNYVGFQALVLEGTTGPGLAVAVFTFLGLLWFEEFLVVTNNDLTQAWRGPIAHFNGVSVSVRG